MKNYFYYGINNEGTKIDGFLLANNKKEAQEILNNRGIITQKIYQKGKLLNNILQDFFKP